jgi:hypothetical protein
MTMSTSALRSLAAAACAVALGVIVPAAAVRTAERPEQQLNQKLPQRFSAIATDMNPDRAASILMLDLAMSRWSTDAEQEEVFAALKEKGSEGLLKALQRQPRVGTIRTPGSLAFDLRYAREEPAPEGGRHLFIMSDRIMSFAELSTQPRSIEYPFMLIDINLKANGEGTGTISVATKLIAAGRLLILENYEMQPIRLTRVKQER